MNSNLLLWVLCLYGYLETDLPLHLRVLSHYQPHYQPHPYNCSFMRLSGHAAATVQCTYKMQTDIN